MRIVYIYDQSFHPAIADIVIALEKSGILRRSETEAKPIEQVTNFKSGLITNPEVGTGNSFCATPEKTVEIPLGHYEKYENVSNLGIDRFLNNHQSVENNFETIAKENLGICEPRKEFEKPLKLAVKEFGHDTLIEAFYNWTTSIGTFMGRRPVTAFLKNPSAHIGSVRVKPQVSNPVLSKTEERIAYVSDNKVFFTGDYRIKLAGLLKEFGSELVITAFEDFFQDLDEKGIQWAAREFLQRAPVMITTIQRKKSEAESAARLQAAAFAAAQQAVEAVPEEEEAEEL